MAGLQWPNIRREDAGQGKSLQRPRCTRQVVPAGNLSHDLSNLSHDLRQVVRQVVSERQERRPDPDTSCVALTGACQR